jgi:hypothetical protein
VHRASLVDVLGRNYSWRTAARRIVQGFQNALTPVRARACQRPRKNYHKILLEPVFRQYPVASFMKVSNFMHPPINIITASLVGIWSYQNTTMHQ